MYAVNSDILIDKIDNYIKNNSALVDVEAIEFSQKFKMVYNEFKLPLTLIKESTICQKIFSSFSILVITNKENKIIGFKLIIDKDGTYQFAAFRKREKDGSLVQIEEYVISNEDLELLLEIQEKPNGQENIFGIKFNQHNRKISSGSNLKELAIAKINQGIEKAIGDENIKIYQIRRKEHVIPRFYHNLNNVISYNDRK